MVTIRLVLYFQVLQKRHKTCRSRRATGGTRGNCWLGYSNSTHRDTYRWHTAVASHGAKRRLQAQFSSLPMTPISTRLVDKWWLHGHAAAAAITEQRLAKTCPITNKAITPWALAQQCHAHSRRTNPRFTLRESLHSSQELSRINDEQWRAGLAAAPPSSADENGRKGIGPLPGSTVRLGRA